MGQKPTPVPSGEKGFPADREGIEWEKSRRGYDPSLKKGTLLERLNIRTFVAVVLVIAWGITLWGIWMEFTK